MRSLRGGNATLSAVPVQTYGYEHGGSESDNAFGRMQQMSERQNELNNTLSGGRGRGRRKKIRGGSNTIEIPQFPVGGTPVSPQTGSSASLALNTSLIQARVDATNDGLIDTQSGGKRKKTKKYRSKHRSNKRTHKKGCKCKYHGKSRRRKTRSNKRHRF